MATTKYTVRKNDTWESIANQYGLDTTILTNVNKESSYLKPGQVLSIPSVSSIPTIGGGQSPFPTPRTWNSLQQMFTYTPRQSYWNTPTYNPPSGTPLNFNVPSIIPRGDDISPFVQWYQQQLARGTAASAYQLPPGQTDWTGAWGGPSGLSGYSPPLSNWYEQPPVYGPLAPNADWTGAWGQPPTTPYGQSNMWDTTDQYSYNTPLTNRYEQPPVYGPPAPITPYNDWTGAWEQPPTTSNYYGMMPYQIYDTSGTSYTQTGGGVPGDLPPGYKPMYSSTEIPGLVDAYNKANPNNKLTQEAFITLITGKQGLGYRYINGQLVHGGGGGGEPDNTQWPAGTGIYRATGSGYGTVPGYDPKRDKGADLYWHGPPSAAGNVYVQPTTGRIVPGVSPVTGQWKKKAGRQYGGKAVRGRQGDIPGKPDGDYVWINVPPPRRADGQNRDATGQWVLRSDLPKYGFPGPDDEPPIKLPPEPIPTEYGGVGRAASQYTFPFGNFGSGSRSPYRTRYYNPSYHGLINWRI